MNHISTVVPGVYATPTTSPLLDQFISCPAAKDLIFSNEVMKPLYIEPTKQAFAETVSLFNKDYKPTKLTISIPEQNLNTKEGLSDLFFEIFNAKTRFVSEQAATLKAARAGDLSMDQFAKRYEENELKNVHEHSQLRQACRALNLPFDETTDLLKDKPLEIALFAQDIDCHTDIYRGDWLLDYQKIYCAKHPEDIRSCIAKKSDLCDMDRVLRLPQDKKQRFLKNRICRMFPNANEVVKTYTQYQKFFEKSCPKSRAAGKQEL